MKLIENLTNQPVELSFGTSGLRGLVTDMTDLECYINACGFLQFLKIQGGAQNGDTVYLAGDLRDSTPRIMRVIAAAIADNGLVVHNCGEIPTPAVAYYALQNKAASIMVTGSHIPSDRNGIKFYKTGGEVLKADESAIQAFVQKVRQREYNVSSDKSRFSVKGELKNLPDLPASSLHATQMYIERYAKVFGHTCLKGKKLIVYQQSAVGRDIIVTILEALGANVVPVERLDYFLPIDTENVTPEHKAKFKQFSETYPDAFATLSTDGDSDRPFVIDETGEFHRGDVLGCVVAEYLQAGYAAIPISSNDAADIFCEQHTIKTVHTKIGSPYIVVAMQAAPKTTTGPIVGWEVNGGFLLGSDVTLNKQQLKALPTRDAVLPIICSLLLATKRGCSVSELFATLPRRYTGGGLIDNVSPAKIDTFKSMVSEALSMDSPIIRSFEAALGPLATLDLTDGLRLHFVSGDTLHLRPSGNSPQFRVYTNSDSQQRADELVEAAIAPGGYIETMLGEL